MAKNSALGINDPSWFCVRSHPKREHFAAAHLRMLEGVEVFNPRIRYRKPTRRGLVTFVESLFPNYLFARFAPKEAYDRVRYAPNVSTIVHFGDRIPVVPEDVIAELRAEFGGEEMQEIDQHVHPGDQVVISEGPFYGLKARVLKVLSPHQRVEVLLEMLGRTTPVVIHPASLLLDAS